MDERPSLLSKTKDLLKRYDLRARKSLAQHFLVDSSVLHKIIEAADLSCRDIVLEVGSGMGVLTRELVQRAGYVIAIELDNKLAEILSGSLKELTNFCIINEDVLNVEPSKLIKSVKSCLPEDTNPQNYKLVANLPYYITSAVLRHFCEASLKPAMMLLMVQKEVAKQIVARPGDMSILSVSVQFYGQPEIVSYVPARSFYPAPEVDSAILKVTMYKKRLLPVKEEKGFFEVTRAGFSAKRKQLANSLANGLGLPKIEVISLLQKAGIDSQRRAETLSLEEWVILFKAAKF